MDFASIIIQGHHEPTWPKLYTSPVWMFSGDHPPYEDMTKICMVVYMHLKWAEVVWCHHHCPRICSVVMLQVMNVARKMWGITIELIWFQVWELLPHPLAIQWIPLRRTALKVKTNTVQKSNLCGCSSKPFGHTQASLNVCVPLILLLTLEWCPLQKHLIQTPPSPAWCLAPSRPGHITHRATTPPSPTYVSNATWDSYDTGMIQKGAKFLWERPTSHFRTCESD